MNITVLGAGAIGSNVAADLAMAGYRPTVIDPWPAQVDALRTCGLKVQLPDCEVAVVEKLATTLVGHVGGKSRNAVLQDHIKGRRTETNQLNGLVVTQGRAVGIATPANEAVVTITQRIERGELEPAPTNLALARALLG